MCGIAGLALADSSRAVDKELLARMTCQVSHRGPDSDGFYTTPGIGLGVRRLAINDLETGDQPISNEDGTIVVVCNGEIYNAPELRDALIGRGHYFSTHSDVEPIVHLYEEDGPQCVEKLRGMFAFALWDVRRQRLMLARDRFGIKPLQFAVGADACYFGSELKSVLASETIDRHLNVTALNQLFSFGFVRGPHTLFSSIQRLLPAHYLLYEQGHVFVQRYWEMRFPARRDRDPSRSAEWWARSLREKLEETVQAHMLSDVPVGAWLSAGLDSSSVVSLMSDARRGEVSTFSVAFEDPEYDEMAWQPTLDDFPQYGLTSSHVTCRADDFARLPQAVWHCEDPFTTAIEIPRLMLSQASARDVKVVLTGEGADEVLGGYPWFQNDRLLRPLGGLPRTLRQLAVGSSLVHNRWPRAARVLMAPAEMNILRYFSMIAPLRQDTLPTLFSPDVADAIAAAEPADSEIFRPSGFDSWHPFDQLQYYELQVRLPDYILHKVDRTSMAYSLEARVPFLDHLLAEFCAQIPPTVKMRRLQEKYVLREAMRDALPHSISHRKKRGLTSPIDTWLRGRLPEFAADMLSMASIREKGYFDATVVSRLLAQHRSGSGNYRDALTGVLCIQLWDDLFVQRSRRWQSAEMGSRSSESRTAIGGARS